MGFTNVAWESRETEQLARDLTDGPGPSSPGQAGASWVRVANELAAISEEYDAAMKRLAESFASQSADAAMRKVEDFGRWLHALSLSAAANGQRAEEAAVAHSVAVLAMPTVPEAVEARVSVDIMASLAAYNGAVLNGRFAELDDAATADQANAAAMMYRYEDACLAIATPWEQPLPPDTVNTAALQAERNASSAEVGGSGVGGGAGSSTGIAVTAPLAPFLTPDTKSSDDSKAVRAVSSTSAATPSAGIGGMSGYGPLAAHGRVDSGREHQSSLTTGPLAGGGEAGASLSTANPSWLPATAHSNGPRMIAEVSWDPTTSVFDEQTVTDQPEAWPYSDDREQALKQVSQHWVARPVIGAEEVTR